MKPKMNPTIEKNARLTAATPVENRGSRKSVKFSSGYLARLSRRDEVHAQGDRRGYRNREPRGRDPPLGTLDDGEHQSRDRSHR